MIYSSWAITAAPTLIDSQIFLERARFENEPRLRKQAGFCKDKNIAIMKEKE